jgi:hypothetical protein
MSDSGDSQHPRFEPFVGEFRAEVKLWTGSADPMVSTGTMVNERVLGDRFLKQDYRGDPNDSPFPSFEGHGFWGYNTTIKRYEGFWVDNASTSMQNQSGTVDDSGKVWTMEGQLVDPQGERMTKLSIITVIDNDRHRLEMFFIKDGAEFKAMEINYERAR